jgi:uncharacterized protein YjiK
MAKIKTHGFGMRSLPSFEGSGYHPELCKSLVILFLFIFTGCSKHSGEGIIILQPVETYKLDIKETSDLCFGTATSILYTVSDNTGKVYKLTAKGKVLSTLSFTGNDPEGVTYVNDQFIYVAEERLRQVIKLDLQGNQLEQKDIAVEINDENEGLEGIAYASFNNRFYLINERNPALLIVTDKDLNSINSYPLSFADDYSGICVDNNSQTLWIVSDLSATINKCTLQGELIDSYHIPVNNAEGIAVDPDNSKIYVISDAESTLYVFDLKP